MLTGCTTHKPPVRATAVGPVAAFTLIEVILAIGIATGLLLVVLTFYRQVTDMRNQVLREAQQVSSMRLVLDRVAADLRAVQQGRSSQFTGNSNSMSFVKVAYTSLAAPATRDPTDLVRVSLNTLFATNETQIIVSGLDRSESSLSPTWTSAALAPTELFDSVSSLADSDDLSLYHSNETQIVTEPFADFVRFVRFRYWDGTAWQFSWTNATPPPGVEIVLSALAAPEAEDTEPDVYPPDAFRRVVFVPAGVPQSPVDATASTNSIAQPE